VSRRSLQTAITKFFPELRHHSPSAPVILVGNFLDKRNALPEEAGVVTYEQGAQAAQDIGAKDYLEISGLSQQNVPLLVQRILEVSNKKQISHNPLDLFRALEDSPL